MKNTLFALAFLISAPAFSAGLPNNNIDSTTLSKKVEVTIANVAKEIHRDVSKKTTKDLAKKMSPIDREMKERVDSKLSNLFIQELDAKSASI